MPIWAKTPGMVSVPTRPSSAATAPNRPSRLPGAAVRLRCVGAASRPAPDSFSTPTARPIVGLAGLDRHDRDPQRGRPGGAGVGHVVDGDAGLADLLLQLLAERGAAAGQVAGRQHADVAHARRRRRRARRARPRTPGRACPCPGACRTWSSRSRGSRRLPPWRTSLRSLEPLRPARSRSRRRRTPAASVPSGNGGQPDLHARACTCSGSGSTLTRLPRTLVPSQSMTAGDERHRHARRGEATRS